MNDTDLPPLDVPLLPEHFGGRQRVVESICARLRQPELLSTQVIGGPKSGKTSLLRYLASPLADPALRAAAPAVRIYMDAAALGPQAGTAQFWMLAWRELKRSAATAALLAERSEVASSLQQVMERSAQGVLDIFDLQDLFDGFAGVKRPVVLLVDEFDTVIANAHFLPPAELFNQVRNLCNRSPRGLAFIVTTGRPLSDVGATAAGPSPPYNHFGTVVLGPLSEGDIRAQLDRVARHRGVTMPTGAAQQIALASHGQPLLASYLARQMVDALVAGANFEEQVTETINDPDGPFARLNDAILAALNARERQAVQAWLTDSNAVTEVQRALLQRLGKFALLPPGVEM